MMALRPSGFAVIDTACMISVGRSVKLYTVEVSVDNVGCCSSEVVRPRGLETRVAVMRRVGRFPTMARGSSVSASRSTRSSSHD